ncbi:MAG: MBL fold metallo-hydrolase [Chloroflexi bacterium]|nr:MBL fold metallo-hydrolase [Chloroflexota bacterium]
MVKVLGLAVGSIAANCYLCWCPETAEAVIIDPGAEAQRILHKVDQHKLHVLTIMLTHFHFDHVMAAAEVHTATLAPVAIHRSDAAFLARQPESLQMLVGHKLPGIQADLLLEDSTSIRFGNESLTVMLTPGHSPGSICLYDEQSNVLLSGDTLFRQGIGRTDLPGGDSDTLVTSIRTRLFILPETTIVYPGHGPSTTIGAEKQSNPFIR